jgi:MFS family permease
MVNTTTGSGVASLRRIVTIAGTGNLSDGLRLGLLPLFALDTTRNPVAISAVAVASGLPWLAGGLLSGPIVDRYRRISVIRVANAIRVVTALAMAIRWQTGDLTIAEVLIVALVLGSGEVVVDNGTQAYVAETVPEEHLSRVSSRLVTAQMAGNDLIGPAAAGFLRSASPLGSLLSLSALCLPGAVVAMGDDATTGEHEEEDDVEGEAPAAQVRAALRKLRPLIALGTIFSLADSMLFAIFVLFVVDELGRPESAFGVLLAIGSIGALAGSWLAERSTPKARLSVLAVPLAFAAVAQLLLVATSSLVLVGVAMVISGLSLGLWNTTSLVVRQTHIPSKVFGRVNGFYGSLVTGIAPVGALVGGLIASNSGTRAAIAVGGVACCVAVVAALAVDYFSSEPDRA